jgi:crossover junction endodeoxyribonuclease RuvC
VRILGIDPGYHRTGFAVLEAGKKRKPELLASGVFTTSRDDRLAERLLSIRRELKELIERHRPDEMALEELFWSKNAKTAIGVAQARGVVMVTAAELGVAVAEYSPTALKLGLTGTGRADKGQVKYMVEHMLPLPEKKRLDDEFDAIALALLHAKEKGLML